MPSTSKGNVVSFEQYREAHCGQADPSKIRVEHAAACLQAARDALKTADRGPPSIHGWVQDGEIKASLDNVAPDSARALLLAALSLCIDLTLLAPRGGWSADDAPQR